MVESAARAQPSEQTRSSASIGRQLAIAGLWLPFYMQWGALLMVVWPSQIAAIAGERKELWNGVTIGLGSIVALVVAPLAGTLSDASTNPRGRRYPYLLWGGLLNIGFLLYLGTFGKGSSLWHFFLGMAGLQFAANWWAGAYAGMIPDVVPRDRRGLASGFLMIMMGLGFGAGQVAAGALASPSGYAGVYRLLAVALAVALGLTLWLVREPPGSTLARPLDLRARLGNFFPPLRQFSDFYWILATRTIVGMGMWGMTTYLLDYLTDVVRAPKPEFLTSMLFLVSGLLGGPIGFLAASLSDRIGRKRLVYLSGGLQAAAAALYSTGAFHPQTWLLWTSAILFGVGNSIYASVDWAFAIDALPASEDAGKDMGIWHASMVLPQVLAPPISAFVLTALKPISLPLAYEVVFACAAGWFLLGTVLVRQVRGVR